MPIRILKKDRKPKSPSAKKRQRRQGDITKIPAGLRKDTTTSAYGDAGKGRPVPEFNKGGEVCRGAGAAIKGTNFTGVF